MTNIPTVFKKMKGEKIVWSLAIMAALAAGVTGVLAKTLGSGKSVEWFVTTTVDDANDTGSIRHIVANASNGDVIRFHSRPIAPDDRT